MNDRNLWCDALPDASASLETVLAAWHAATLRLDKRTRRCARKCTA